ncbi:MAG: response regulator [Cyanobacteriota bacterium]|nr:response regulator [Cyanobacteriota bacterium]
MISNDLEKSFKKNVSATILVVDDKPINLRLLGRFLSDSGYEVRLAGDGELALKSVKTEPPDLILLDIMMPIIDGYEVCARLKNDPETRNIPIIFLSAQGEVFDKIKAFDLGAVDYITKPFSPEEVAGRIDRQLRIWQLSKELAKQNNLLQGELEKLRNSDGSNSRELQQQLAGRIDSLTRVNERLQQEIALREKELRDRQILETELKEQNARLEEEVRERQEAQKAVAQREREFRALVENAPDVILRVNRKFEYLYVNPKFVLELSKPAEEIVGKTIEELCPTKSLAAFWETTVQQAFDGGEEQAIEFEATSATGVKYYAARVVPEKGENGEIESVLAIARDITERKRAEIATRESRRLLEQISESSPNVLYIYDVAQQRNVYSNHSAAEILGYSQEEIEEMGDALLPTIMHPEDVARVPEKLEKISALRDGEVLEREYRLRDRKNGEWRTFFVREVPFSRTSEGQLEQIIGTAVEISDRVAAEREREELLERERLAREEAETAKEQLAQNLDSMTDAFVAIDKEWRFTYANKQYESFAQQERSELLGKSIWEVFPILRGTNGERQLRRALSQQVSVEFIEFWSPINCWFEVRAYPTKDGLWIYCCDVSDRIAAETLQRETAEREKTLTAAIERIRDTLDIETIFTATTEELRLALQCSRVGIYRFDRDYSGEFVAESAKEELLLLQSGRESLGLGAESQLWKNSCISTLFDSSGESKNNCYLEDSCCLVVADIQEVRFTDEYRQQLEEFEIKAYLIVPIFHNGQFWGLLGAYDSCAPRLWKAGERNMAVQIGHQLGVALQQAELLAETKRQAAELEKAAIAADAANRAKSEFLASMSHELRTPLNAILGFTQVMGRDRSLSSLHQENLEIINRAGEHLLALINDILEMSQIEAGRTTFNESCFNLAGMLENLENMLEFKARSKGLQLTFDIPSSLPAAVTTDEGKLRQVLINILGNAIKFTQRGSISLRLKIENRSLSNSRRLLFEIEDTGPGIPPEEIDTIFEAFGQSQEGRKYQEGSGLGLPISKKFVELMGGELKVRSTLGEGSIFAFDVLITSIEGVVIGSLNRGRAIALAPDTPEYRILVADDRPDNRYLLQTLLTSIGFAVGEAENGEEAVALWSSWEPHLILMDMQMPVMDGYEATQRIQATDKGKTTVIIALTASAFEEDRQKILGVGCDDFVSKPFQEEILLEKIGDRLGIEYIYENDSPHYRGEGQTLEETLSPEELKEYLSKMPPAWVEELYRATVMGTDDTILELLEKIPPELELLAKTLEDLTNNYQFEVILEAIETDAINN